MGFRARYEKAIKDHKGNIVKPLDSALKNLDSGKGSSKEAALGKVALKELGNALTSLHDFEKGANGNQKKAASDLRKELLKLENDIEQEAKLAEVNSNLKTAELSKEDLKDTQAIVKNVADLSDDVQKLIDKAAGLKKDLWKDIEGFSGARWDAMKAFAKQHGASINGFRSFPMCIAMMVEECQNAKPTFGNKPRKGSAQTAGYDPAEAKKQQKEAEAEGASIQSEFIDFSQNAVAADLGKVNDAIAKLNKGLAEIDHTLSAMDRSTEKLAAEVKDLGGSVKALQHQKIKICLSGLKNKVDQAEQSSANLHKVVNKEKGLGRQDGDIRDAFNDIPELSAADLQNAVGAVESGMKTVAKSV